MLSNNPIRKAYDQVWAMLENCQDFLALFPNDTPHQLRYNLGGVADTTTTYMPDPDDEDHLLPAEYPRVRVTVRQVGTQSERDSTNSTIVIAYDIEVCTGVIQQAMLMDCIWAIFQTCVSWRTFFQGSVFAWNGYNPVVDVDLKQAEMTHEHEKRNRGVHQWICLWSLEVMFKFNTAYVQAMP
jgi:hypothetical protein